MNQSPIRCWRRQPGWSLRREHWGRGGGCRGRDADDWSWERWAYSRGGEGLAICSHGATPAGPPTCAPYSWGLAGESGALSLPFLQWLQLPNTHHPGDFPGSPVLKTRCFQCQGCGFKPWSGN